ncbi:large ribosomal subunit protein uL23m [Epargyreus clarus]|uniref:large ribosomal subunit protein uL23m n=1 Tax=Epargyreus clarus TaxID=520877 RepID=UPI003C2F16E9
MSTRWYPIYQKGNPQLRVFLPNFWMKLLRPYPKQLPNVVHFECSIEMTKFDIKNYLEKIYNVPVADVRTRILLGKFRKEIGKGYVMKDDDIKIAYVTLPKTTKFEFPDLFKKKSQDEENLKSLDDAKKAFKGYIKRNTDRPDVARQDMPQPPNFKGMTTPPNLPEFPQSVNRKRREAKGIGGSMPTRKG